MENQEAGAGDRSVPLATYRVQLSPGFGFDEAAALAPYLAELGVSHLYASPSLQAAPGSTHGYDVVDPTRVSEELGGPGAHRRLSGALDRVGLGQVLDIVPNHLAVTGPENPRWWDVLSSGRASPWAPWFDIDWDPPETRLAGRVALAILGDHYHEVLAAGGLALERAGGSIRVRYADRLAPIAPADQGALVARAAGRVAGAAATGAGVDEELAAVAAGLGALPPVCGDQGALARRLDRLCRDHRVVAWALDQELAAVNADRAALHRLLEAQPYRLAHWRTAAQELNYRRFFDIDTLAGVRVEDPAVFEDTHRLVLSWVAAGTLDGLRVDHVDGLRSPGAYLAALRAASGGAWLVVEKVLEPGEALRQEWPVAGTTGYDFAASVSGLFVDPAGEEPLTGLWGEVAGTDEPFAEVAHRAKHDVLSHGLATDLGRLTACFVAVCEGGCRYRDYTRAQLAAALEEVIACFPVYRTYLGAEGPAHPDDVGRVQEAVGEAGRRRPELGSDLLGLVQGVLLSEGAGAVVAEARLRFQQLTGPVMAKGVEDTALYVYNRLVARNDVGFDPGSWATTPAAFHADCAARGQRWPGAMVATSTHDTKRSEDVRARLAVVSERPGAWRGLWEAWREGAARWRSRREGPAPGAGAPGGDWPDPATEYLVLQTLVGAWPLSPDRAVAYLAKATREAKVHTSWTDPCPAFDRAVEDYVRGVLGDRHLVGLLEGFLAGPFVEAGWVTALAQALVKFTVPGVPDTYQGTELWDLSLVDPDNRRPVDFALRRRLLARLGTVSAEEAWEQARWGGEAGGLAKLLVTHRALALRRQHPDWLGPGASYRPLGTAGPRADRVVAFCRGAGVVTVVPRLVWGLAAAGRARPGDGPDPGGIAAELAAGLGEATVDLPAGRWRDWLTGEAVAGGARGAGALLARFPVALLARED